MHPQREKLINQALAVERKLGQIERSWRRRAFMADQDHGLSMTRIYEELQAELRCINHRLAAPLKG